MAHPPRPPGVWQPSSPLTRQYQREWEAAHKRPMPLRMLRAYEEAALR